MGQMKAYRFQLRARPRTEAQLRRYSGMARWVWNRAVAEQRTRYARGERYAGYAEMCRWLKAWRRDPKTQWLADGPIHVEQQVLRRLDASYRRFFKATMQATIAKTTGSKGSGRQVGQPRFKRFGDEPGLRFPHPDHIEFDDQASRIKLPKLGWIRLRQSQPLVGTVKNASVGRECERWFVSLQVEIRDVPPPIESPPTLGIDLGLTNFAAFSDPIAIAGHDGRTDLVPAPKLLARAARQVRHAQRALARKQSGSKNRAKARLHLSRIHRRIARRRRDWIAKLTTQIAKEHVVIVIEDLRIANMTRSAKRTVQKPGKGVGRKAKLNLAILDAAWGEFRRQLDYKAAWRGGRVFAVDPAYSSRTCRVCGHESAENRQSQASFRCVACGHSENADVHAAKNILAAGHAVWAGELARRPMPVEGT